MYELNRSIEQVRQSNSENYERIKGYGTGHRNTHIKYVY